NSKPIGTSSFPTRRYSALLAEAWSARLSVPGGTAVGLFAPASRNFPHQRKESRMTEAAAPPAENEHGLTPGADPPFAVTVDLGEHRKSTRLNSRHVKIAYA